MFHHFHDNKIHKSGQGSINENNLYQIIKFIGRKNILNADDFFIRFKENRLKSNHVCLTFDDGIKSQIDIALPVLEDLKIKCFFFIYSSLFTGKPDLLEVYRYFRINYFDSVENFYKEFYLTLNEDLSDFFLKNNQSIKISKKKFPHYSVEDIKFRLVRDQHLIRSQYQKIMFKMFNKKKFYPKEFYKYLFFNQNDMFQLKELGHSIGLHSHKHPTLMENLSYEQQYKEYQKNLDIFNKILKIDKSEFKTMSHPCGSYNEDTLNILSKLGIELGFKQIMSIEKEKGMNKVNNSFLEIAREDHSKIMKMIK